MMAMIPPPALPAPVPPHSALAKRIHDLDTPYLLASYTTAFPHATPSQADNIALAANRLKGSVIPGGATFSYNAAVGPRTPQGGFKEGRIFVGNRIVKGFGGGVCQVATTLYDVVLLAHLPVEERHAHTLTVPYVPPGQDATVAFGLIDFRFRNPYKDPVLLWSWVHDGRVTLALYGPKSGPEVSIQHKVLARYPFPVEKITDPTLPQGSERVDAPGQAGCDVTTWLLVRAPGSPPARLDLGEDHYAASPRMVRVGTGPVSGCR